MTHDELRPVPRWVHAWGVATAVVTLSLLLALGGLVTSFRVGMSDPVWPTEPWFLAANGHVWAGEPRPGFLIEHTHRAAGWAVGLMATVFAVAAWAVEPGRRLRWAGLAAVGLTLVAYGEFHRGMMAASKARDAASEVPLPVGSGLATLGGAAACLVVCGIAVSGRAYGRWARAAAVVALLAVMAQGLLGGFRVFLDQLYGTQLAAYHGVFGQLVFAGLAAAAYLTGPRRPDDEPDAADFDRVGGLAVAVPVLVAVQLVWGAWLRHLGSPVAQRLHVLTAFAVAGLVVWLATRADRRRLGGWPGLLLAIVGVQVALGVEAWMAKYAAAGPDAALPPELRPITQMSAGVRTAHQVVGAALLAATTVFALRVWRTPVADTGLEPCGVADATDSSADVRPDRVPALATGLTP